MTTESPDPFTGAAWDRLTAEAFGDLDGLAVTALKRIEARIDRLELSLAKRFGPDWLAMTEEDRVECRRLTDEWCDQAAAMQRAPVALTAATSRDAAPTEAAP